MRKGSLIVALGMAAMTPGGAAGQEAADPAALAERFHSLAFQVEDGGETRLVRWEEPLRYEIVDGDAWKDEIRAQFDELAELTGLSAEEVESGGNVVVAFGTPEALQATGRILPNPDHPDALADFDCRMWTSEDPLVATVAIRSDLPEAGTRACIARETTRILGLRGSPGEATDTVFAHEGGSETLTDTDRQLVRLLYRPEVQQLMSWEEAAPVVEGVIAEGGG